MRRRASTYSRLRSTSVTTALDCEALFFVDNANPVRRNDNPCAHTEGTDDPSDLETSDTPPRVYRGSQEAIRVETKPRPVSFKIARHYSNDGNEMSMSAPVRQTPFPLLRQRSQDEESMKSGWSKGAHDHELEEVEEVIDTLKELQAKADHQRDLWYNRSKEKRSQHNLQMRLRMCQATSRELDMVILQKHKESMANFALQIPDGAVLNKRRQRVRRNAAPDEKSAKKKTRQVRSGTMFSRHSLAEPESIEMRHREPSAIDDATFPQNEPEEPDETEDSYIEVSTTEGVPERQWWQWKQTGSEITAAEKMEQAAIYIDDARFGRPVRIHRTGPLPRKILKFQTSTKWRQFLTVVTLIHSAVAIWTNFGGAIVPEKCVGDYPAGTYEHLNTPNSNILVSRILEAMCLFVYLIDLSLCFYHEGVQQFRKKSSNLFYLIFVFICIGDLIASICAAPHTYPRFLRSFVAAILVINHQGTFRSLKNIYRIAGTLIQMGFCLGIVITIYTVLGVALFSHKYPDGATYTPLRRHGEAALSLFVLSTTENYPEIMDGLTGVQNRAPTLFFISFLVISVFILMAVFTGVVFNAHKTEMKNTALSDRINERKALMAAFFTLMEDGSQNALTFPQWALLLKEIQPNMTHEEASLLFRALDDDQSGTIDLLEFFSLCDVLLLRFRRRQNFLTEIVKYFRLDDFTNKIRKRLPIAPIKRLIASRAFNFYQIGSVFLYIVIQILEKIHHDNEFNAGNLIEYSQCNPFGIGKIIVIIIFFLECLGRMVVKGAQSFFRSGWNIADFTCVSFGMLSLLIIASPRVGCNGDEVIVALCQSIVSLRVVLFIERFRSLIMSFIHFSDLMPAVGGILYVVLFVYANVGGEMWCQCKFSNPNIQFMDFSGALLTLFQVVTSSNWHDILYSSIDKFGDPSADSYFAIIYYISFYFIAVIVLLNLVISVVIDAYVVEQELQNEERHILLDANGVEKASQSSSRKGKRVSVKMERRYSREIFNREMKDESFQARELQTLQEYAPIDVMKLHEMKQQVAPQENHNRRLSVLDKFRTAAHSVSIVNYLGRRISKETTDGEYPDYVIPVVTPSAPFAAQTDTERAHEPIALSPVKRRSSRIVEDIVAEEEEEEEEEVKQQEPSLDAVDESEDEKEEARETSEPKRVGRERDSTLT